MLQVKQWRKALENAVDQFALGRYWLQAMRRHSRPKSCMPTFQWILQNEKSSWCRPFSVNCIFVTRVANLTINYSLKLLLVLVKLCECICNMRACECLSSGCVCVCEIHGSGLSEDFSTSLNPWVNLMCYKTNIAASKKILCCSITVHWRLSLNNKVLPRCWLHFSLSVVSIFRHRRFHR